MTEIELISQPIIETEKGEGEMSVRGKESEQKEKSHRVANKTIQRVGRSAVELR